MNAMVAAAIGVVVTLIAYNLAGTIQHKALRMLAQLASVLIPVALVGLMTANPEAASQAGQYYFGGIVAAYILGKLFGGPSKST
jgi:hypothetical protein